MTTIGTKIKNRRREIGLTQAELAKGTVTRNMICAIENGTAMPSLDTLLSLAEKLDVPPSYLFDDTHDLSFYKKESKLPQIKKLFSERKYKECESMIHTLGVADDELNFIGAICSFAFGKNALDLGNLETADKYFQKAEVYCSRTVYPTKRITAQLAIYKPIVKNIKSPLLELDDTDYISFLKTDTDLDFYNFIKQTSDYDYKDEIFHLYFQAKTLLKQRKYENALTLLLRIEEMKNEHYRAPVILSVYTDIETCYRELCDFEKAYRYSTKRLSLMEYFRS